jgi:hypothetical protein
MIGQTIVNVEMGKGRSRISTVAAGMVLLMLVTALSEVMAKIPMAVLAGMMVIVAVKTFSWHSIRRDGENGPVAETLVMLVTVAATVSTSNLAIGVLAGIIVMALLPARIKRGYIRKIVASPRKIKKPPVSVMAVIITLEPTAGSPQLDHRHRDNHAHHRRHQQVEHHRQRHHAAQLHIVIQPPGDAPIIPPHQSR